MASGVRVRGRSEAGPDRQRRLGLRSFTLRLVPERQGPRSAECPGFGRAALSGLLLAARSHDALAHDLPVGVFDVAGPRRPVASAAGFYCRR
jgi:hypothetical protein